MEKKEQTDLSVILVNLNDRAHLGRCLSSLQTSLESLETEVIIVDNNSEDGSREFVRSAFPWIGLIENRENVGYAKANNIGIKACNGLFVLLLNTDTVVPPEGLAVLLKEIKARPRCGAIGPALVHENRSFQVSFGRRVDFFSEFFQKLLFNPYFKMRPKHSRKIREAGWLSGACLLLRKTALEETGLFDENFFLYFEDIDLCRRLRRKGYDLLFFPEIEVVHVGGATTSPNKWLNRLEYRRSQAYFYRKNNSSLSNFFLKLYLRLNFFFLSTFLLRQREEKALLSTAKKEIFKGS